MNQEITELFNELGYNNLFYPFEDLFRQDRIVAFSHRTSNRIEIYNNVYPLKYNEVTGKVMKLTAAEASAIQALKKSIGWDEGIHSAYLFKDKEESFGLGNRDYGFYERGIHMDRIEPMLKEVIKTLSFEDICKMFREICYDQVCYYSKNSKGRIYNGEYSEEHISQATKLQRKVSCAVDLYNQSIVSKNTFNEDYLKDRLGL